jgi:hypothetical protein
VQLVRRHLDGLGDGRDVDDLLLLRHFRHGQAYRRGETAQDDVHLVLGDQLFHRRGGGCRVQLIVALDRFDLAAHDAALRVQLLDGELMAGHGWNAVDGAAAGQRIQDADLDRLLGKSRPDTEGADGNKQCAVFHVCFLPI